MVTEYQGFRVGDVVKFKGGMHPRSPRYPAGSFTISAFYAGDVVVWGEATETEAKGCPGCYVAEIELVDGPW